MGKEWLYWVTGGAVGGSNDGSGGEGTKSSKRRNTTKEVKEAVSSGCMSAVLQLFDLHQFQISVNRQQPFKSEPLLQEEAIATKGIEAPRNSLDMEGPTKKASSVSLLTMEDEKNLNIPVGIRIKTRTSFDSRSPRMSISSLEARTRNLSSECNINSPGVKAPSLVARLMGLDLLPESCTPPSSSSSMLRPQKMLHLHPQAHTGRKDLSGSKNLLCRRSTSSRSFFEDDIGIGARSLPESPRISSARRSDVDHRLSLQISRENIGQEFQVSALKKMCRRRRLKALEEDENRSPSQHAKQIVKQVKESASRKFGLDITNTARNKEPRRDEILVAPKPRKPSKILAEENLSEKVTVSSRQNQRNVHQHQQEKEKNSSEKCKKVLRAKRDFCLKMKLQQTSSDAIRNKKDDIFVRLTAEKKAISMANSKNKFKKTPLSNECVNVNGPTFQASKKDLSHQTEISSHKQMWEEMQSQVSDDALSSKTSTQLLSTLSHSYKMQKRTCTVQGNIPQNKCITGAILAGDVAEYNQYIQRILRCIGIIDNATSISIDKWHSLTNPLDPSIFPHLEPFYTAATTTMLAHQCNRKLIFELVNELLADIFKQYMGLKPWSSKNCQLSGSELVEKLCKRIQGFPSAKCQVLEDIDALIDTICKSQVGGLTEERESIASEIEREIMDSLVHETLSTL